MHAQVEGRPDSVDPSNDARFGKRLRSRSFVGDPAIDAEGRLRWILTAIFVVIAVGGALDLAMDQPATLWSVHVLFEASMLAFSLAAVVYLWSAWRSADHSLEKTRAEVDVRAAERDAWRARAEKLLRGLGEEIDVQLRDWGITPTERETALLLLKGYGH
jgi:hypothetical protein